MIIAASGHGPQRGESECEGGISGAMSVAASKLVDRLLRLGVVVSDGRSHPNAVHQRCGEAGCGGERGVMGERHARV